MKKILSSKYVKNIATLSLGTVIAQLIVVGISPIITRLYTAEEMGLYTIVLTIVTMFIPILNGRYDMAIVTASDDQEAREISNTSIIFGIITSLVIFTLIMIYANLNNEFKNIEYLFLLSLPILLINSILNVLNAINNRLNKYRVLSSVSIKKSIAQALIQVLLGIFKFGSIGLILSLLISLFAGLKHQIKSASLIKFKLLYIINYTQLIRTIKKYKKMPLFSAPAAFMNSLSYSILIIFISSLYNVQEVGYYSLAFRVLGLPLIVISSSVSRVFFSRASEEQRIHGNFYSVFKKTSIYLFGVSLVLFSIIMLTSERLFGLIFGHDWEKAGLYVAILSPLFAVRFVVSTISSSILIANKQKTELLLQFLFLLESLLVYILAILFKLNIEWFLGILTAIFSVTYVFWYIILNKMSKGNEHATSF